MVYLLSEIIGGFEFHDLAGSDRDLLLGLGIDARALGFLDDGERAEADELNLVVVGERLLD